MPPSEQRAGTHSWEKPLVQVALDSSQDTKNELNIFKLSTLTVNSLPECVSPGDLPGSTTVSIALAKQRLQVAPAANGAPVSCNLSFQLFPQETNVNFRSQVQEMPV